MTIYKYPIKLADVQTLNLPFGAEILTIQMQHGNLCLWAKVQENVGDTEARTIEVFGTGQPMDFDSRTYIATVQDGSFVWHVFERI